MTDRGPSPRVALLSVLAALVLAGCGGTGGPRAPVLSAAAALERDASPRPGAVPAPTDVRELSLVLGDAVPPDLATTDPVVSCEALGDGVPAAMARAVGVDDVLTVTSGDDPGVPSSRCVVVGSGDLRSAGVRVGRAIGDDVADFEALGVPVVPGTVTGFLQRSMELAGTPVRNAEALVPVGDVHVRVQVNSGSGLDPVDERMLAEVVGLLLDALD